MGPVILLIEIIIGNYQRTGVLLKLRMFVNLL